MELFQVRKEDTERLRKCVSGERGNNNTLADFVEYRDVFKAFLMRKFVFSIFRRVNKMQRAEENAAQPSVRKPTTPNVAVLRSKATVLVILSQMYVIAKSRSDTSRPV